MNRTIIDGVPSPIGGRYAVEITVCEQMGWTYTDLMNTPADMVDEIVIRLNAQGKAEQRRHKLQEQKSRSQGQAAKGKR